jgi:hypothetical protein
MRHGEKSEHRGSLPTTPRPSPVVQRQQEIEIDKVNGEMRFANPRN